MMKKRQKIYSILKGKCPRCHQGDFFEFPFTFNPSKITKLHNKCSECDLKYMIEPSFFYGAMYVNYGITVALSVITFLVSKFVFYLSLLESFAAIFAVLILSASTNLRLSRILWINMFVKFDENSMLKKTKQMRALFFIITFLLNGVFFIEAQEKETATLTVNFTFTKYKKGNIYLAIYDSKENYMEKAYKSAGKKVNDSTIQLIFKDVEKGDYAFSFYHDVNGNEKMDTNFLGIPKEPYGFSNNLQGRFGPPKFEKAKFYVTDNQTFNINVK